MLQPAARAGAAELKLKARPRAGDSLHTAADAHADLELLANTLISVMPGSEAKLVTIALTKDGDETGDAIRQRDVHLALSRGALVVSQEEEPEMTAALRLAVETAQKVAQTNFDAVFRIEADEQRTRIIAQADRSRSNPSAKPWSRR